MRIHPRLPAEEVVFLASLSLEHRRSRLYALHTEGWSLSSLANSLEPPAPKSTVHYQVTHSKQHPQDTSLPLPPPPPKKTTPKIPNALVRSISMGLTQEDIEDIQNVAPDARRYRANTPDTSAPAIANEELTRIAKRLHAIGVPTAEIAKAANVSYRAMAKRVAK